MDVQTQARDSPILNIAPPTTVIQTDNDSGHEVTPVVGYSLLQLFNKTLKDNNAETGD